MLTTMAHDRKRVKQHYQPLPVLVIKREDCGETLRFAEVAALLGYRSRRGLDHLIATSPDFPKPFRRHEPAGGGRTTAPMLWRAADVFKWIDAKAKRARQGS